MRSRLPRRSSRAGFTLLEVLLAATLCAILVGASFQAVHLTWHYRRAGETGQQSSRIRFGLVEDLAFDLRAAVPPIVSEEVSDLSHVRTGAGPLLPRTDFSEKLLAVDQANLLRPTHLVGSSRSLMLLRQTSSPRFPKDAGESSQTPIHQVVWWSASDGPPRVHWAMSGPQRRVRAPAILRGEAGLLRTEWPFEPSSAGHRPPPPLTRSVERSISSIGFRYFDGHGWRSDWNSYDEKTLPAAVEVTLMMSDGAEPPLRSVVHLPQSRAVFASRSRSSSGSPALSSRQR